MNEAYSNQPRLQAVKQILLFIATQKINKHTEQLISVNALGLAHKQYNFMQSSSCKNIISIKMGDIDI